MKRLFVPKNIAQLARDNGFNEVCLAAYGSENDDNNSFPKNKTTHGPTQNILVWLKSIFPVK